MASKNMEFKYENNVAKCIIHYQNQKFIGEAICHPDDLDFASERTGMTIAEIRALIKVKTFIRDFEIKPQLKILKHFNANIRNSKNYNPTSYEAKMLYSQIKAIQRELDEIKKEISEDKQFLKEYINGKDKVYKKLRQARSN